MIATKAVAAILMTGLGSLAAGTAAYLNVNPRAFALEPRHHSAAPPVPAAKPVVQAPAPQAAQTEVIAIDPVVITTRPQTHHKMAVVKSPPAQSACSDWQDLATGPAGRKVRLLCPH